MEVLDHDPQAVLIQNTTLWTCGKNSGGQLGQNNITKYSSPVQIGSDTDWVDIGGAYFGVNTLKSGL